MKKKAFATLVLLLIFCSSLVSHAAWNDTSKWSAALTGERAYKTPNQQITKVADGIQFTGIEGERENFTYGYSEPLNFPSGDLTIEFTIKEGTESEMLYSFALMDKPNWGSWYSSNDMTGFIFNVRPNDYVEFHVGQALDWPLNVEIEWPEYDENNVHTAIATKDKRMKFEFKKTTKGYKLYVNGFEIKQFEEKSSEFFLNDVLPKGTAYLTVSGLNYTFDPELRSTLVIRNIVSTKKADSTTSKGSSSKGGGGPAIDDTSEEETSSSVISSSSETEESSQASEESDVISSESESSTDTSTQTPEGSPNYLWIIIVAAVVVLLAAGGLCYYFLIYKKKKN